MRFLLGVCFCLCSTHLFAGNYYVCGKLPKEGQAEQFVFSDDGKDVQQRSLYSEGGAVVSGVLIELDVTTFNKLDAEFEIEGVVPRKLADKPMFFRAVVKKDSDGQISARYRRTIGGKSETISLSSCEIKAKVDQFRNNENFLRLSRISDGVLDCATDNFNFIFDHENKRVWAEKIPTPSGKLFGSEHVVLEYQKLTDGYQILTSLFDGDPAAGFKIDLQRELSTGKWMITVRDLVFDASETGSCK